MAGTVRHLAQGGAAGLYACTDEPRGEASALGLALCDAAPTSELAARAAADNLQEREGALIVEVETDGITSNAGFHTGDVIYRVGGVDVAGAVSAAEQLAQIQARSDTVVNFLRRGRPYRIKLRRE